MAAFPLIKLASLAIRQISKPLANHLKTRAKESLFFRTKICMPPAQFYHWCEVQVKARLLNLGSPKEVAKLNEQAAIDLGSELIGDMFMFTITATALIAEYTRQSRRTAEEKANLESRLQQLESTNCYLNDRSSSLEYRLLQVETKLSDLEDVVDRKVDRKK